MTVTVQTPRADYAGDGLNNTFSFAFTIIQSADLIVLLDNVQQIEFTDYTIQNLTPAGGDVVFVVIPPDLSDIALIRDTPKSQQVDYMPFTEFPADTHEFVVDKLTLIVQELDTVMNGGTVSSVFGRIGDVVADCSDYAACYPALGDWNAHIADPNAHHVKVEVFTELGDVPNAYTGFANYLPTVKAAEDGLEFAVQIDDLLGEAFPSGLHQGGELNIVGGTNAEIIAGAGVITDSYADPLAIPIHIHLSWNTNQIPITAPAVAGTVVYFVVADGGGSGPIAGSSLGVLTEFLSIPTPVQVRDNLFIGLAIHNGSTWNEVTSPNTVNSTPHTLFEYMRSQGAFIETGGQVTEAAAFTLDQAAGVIFELGRNYINDTKDPNREPFAQRLNLQWRYTNRDFSIVSALTGTVDPSQYDDGVGVVAIPGGSRVGIQRLYLDAADNFWVLWGQELHDFYTEAIGAIGADTEGTTVPFLLEESILLGHIIAEKAETDWMDERSAFHSVIAGGGGGGGVTNFTGLTDTPADYIGQAGKLLAVKSTEDGVQFSAPTIDDAGKLTVPGEAQFDGNVGIGVAPGTRRLHVVGRVDIDVETLSESFRLLSSGGSNDLNFEGTANNNSRIFFKNNGAYNGQLIYNHNQQSMTFFTDAVERLRLDATGLDCKLITSVADELILGEQVGEQAALRKFDNTGIMTLSGGDSALTGSNLRLFAGAHLTRPYDIMFRKDQVIITEYLDATGTWDFQDKDIVTTGNIGINISPAARLHVDGTVRLDNLPTTDPGTPGELWDDNGTLKISQ